MASIATLVHLITSLASISCAIHCALSPLLLMTMPMMAPSFFSPFWEVSMLVFSFLMSAYILMTGYCSHKKWQALCFYSVAVLFWGLHYFCSYFYHHASALYLVCASLFVILAYIVNHRYVKACVKDCCESSTSS